MSVRFAAGLLVAAIAASMTSNAAAQPAHDRYTRALARERALRNAPRTPRLTELRALIATYEQFVRRYPSSGYSDNALWQAANLALLAHDRHGQARDRETAVRLLNQLKQGYTASSLLPRAEEALERLSGPPLPPPGATAKAVAAPAAEEPAAAGDVASERVTIRAIKRTPLPDGIRVIVEMDGEALFRQERLDNPARVFFDLRGARPAPALRDARLRFKEDLVREIRLGRHPQNTTRIVMDMKGVESYSVFTLYAPFRLVVDFRRASVPTASVHSEPLVMPLLPLQPERSLQLPTMLRPRLVTGTILARPSPSLDKPGATAKAAAPLPGASPAVPAANSNGRFSLARQLGLGVSRIVIDPGHGGHDPGARANGLSEAELVLDVAVRLRKLLEKETGIELAMTREQDVFVPLEQRTAFANREGADLFLSIHANASRNSKARGVETYFLNFASNPEAQAVAARENSASARTMHHLPDIVRAIALNNKIDESRDFAAIVQNSMVRRLSARNRQLKDLGVKQAPFVVLIGAGMPSVLAEISFLTNKQEGQLLKTPAYRQHIAEALLDALLRYQQSLKSARKVAAK